MHLVNKGTRDDKESAKTEGLTGAEVLRVVPRVHEAQDETNSTVV